MGSRERVIALPAEIARKSLTREQERSLSKAIMSGNDERHEARNELIESNLRLVRKIAQGYSGKGVTLPELISSGQLGLMMAATKYDGRPSTKFSSYAQWWIRRSIREEIAKKSNLLTISPSTLRRAKRLAAVARAYEEKYGHEPTISELAAEAKETLRRVRCLACVSNFSFSSLERNREAGHEVAAEEKQRLADADTVHKLHRCLQRLPEKERAVIDARFGLSGNEHTLKAVGRKLSLSSERVRQIELLALERLRQMLEEGAA